MRSTGRNNQKATPKHAKATPGKRSGQKKQRKSRSSSARRSSFPRWKIVTILIGLLLIASVVGLHIYSHPDQFDTTGFTHGKQLKNAIVIDGIDVSYAQGNGNKINWRKVKRSGVDFVFVRAGYRDSTKGKIHKDSQFKKNIQRARKAGLMVGVYFYSQATSKKEAAQEARALLRYVKDYDIDLPLVIDYEILTNGRLHRFISGKKYSPRKGTAILEEFCSTVRNAGYEAGVYSNYDLLVNKLQGSKLARKNHVWVANYNSATDYPNKYELWQASNQATVSGINGTVDQNFWYFRKGGMTTYGKRNAAAKSLKYCSIQLKKHSYYYTGGPVEPKLVVKYGKKTLQEGTDYRVRFAKNASPGYAYAIVTGLGNYKDMKITRFRIKALL